MEVKAHKNGNMHIKFDQTFIRTLNIEFGRLKGWINNKAQAADELNIKEAEVNYSWKKQFQLDASNVLMICE